MYCTICHLPKVSGESKRSGKTYYELYLMATRDGDQELRKYFQFIYKKYHGSYDGSHKSQAVDLPGCLMYMNFDPEKESSSWKRVIKP